MSRARRRRATAGPCGCWPLVLVGVAFSILNSFLPREEEEEPWPSTNTTGLDRAQLGGSNDTAAQGNSDFQYIFHGDGDNILLPLRRILGIFP